MHAVCKARTYNFIFNGFRAPATTKLNWVVSNIWQECAGPFQVSRESSCSFSLASGICHVKKYTREFDMTKENSETELLKAHSVISPLEDQSTVFARNIESD